MRTRRTNRFLKKRLRSDEKRLGKDLEAFLTGFDPQDSLDPQDWLMQKKSLDVESSFRLLLNLRWAIYSLIYYRLKLHPGWRRKRWFLELFDVDEVKPGDDSVELIGDMVWWAEGEDAVGNWWPVDHEPHRSGSYKKKMRGDLSGGHWVLEPVIVKLKRPNPTSRTVRYVIEFGKGSTYLKIKSRR